MTTASTGRPLRERLIVAAAQTGPVEPGTTRGAVVARLVALLEGAARRGAELVVFTEVALTPFFPHWWIEDEEEIDSYCERNFPNDSIAALTETARDLGVAFHIGYSELAEEGGRTHRFNAAMLFGPDGSVVGKYRKIHLPGYHDFKPGFPFQNLEKRYFEVGDLGLPVWDVLGTRIGMSICNDRRWPETYRVLGLQGAELVLIGYNTPRDNPAMPETDRLADFHNHLCMQAGAYANGMWVVGSAKAGTEAGVEQIGGSCIISPTGELVAVASSDGDELVVAEVDLRIARRYKEILLDMGRNRQPQTYGAITELPVNEV